MINLKIFCKSGPWFRRSATWWTNTDCHSPNTVSCWTLRWTQQQFKYAANRDVRHGSLLMWTLAFSSVFSKKPSLIYSSISSRKGNHFGWKFQHMQLKVCHF